MEYEDRLRKLKWPTLETRGLNVTRLLFGVNRLTLDDPFEFITCNSTRTNHLYKLYAKPAECNPYKHSFPIPIGHYWNSYRVYC